MARNLVGFRADPRGLARSFLDALETTAPLEDSADALVAEIKGMLATSGSGEIYRVRGETRRAAAGGKPPAFQTGELHASIRSRPIIRRLRSRPKIRVSTDREEAAALEFGFKKSGGGIAQHPFFRPALLRARPHMVAVFRESMRAKGLRSAKRRGLAFRARQQLSRQLPRALPAGS